MRYVGPIAGRPGRLAWRRVQLVLSALALLVVVVDGIGVAVHTSHATYGVRAGQIHHAPPATPNAPLSPTSGPGTVTLDAGLLAPADLGDGYHLDDAAAVSFLASAPCLAGLGPSPAQEGRAVRGMSGPDTSDAGAIPSVFEAVISYPGAASVGVYRSLVSALQACPAFGFSIEGTTASTPLSESALATPGGEPSSVFSGQVQTPGGTHTIQIAVVLDGYVDVAVMYWDRVPSPANGVSATVAGAIAKLARSA